MTATLSLRYAEADNLWAAWQPLDPDPVLDPDGSPAAAWPQAARMQPGVAAEIARVMAYALPAPLPEHLLPDPAQPESVAQAIARAQIAPLGATESPQDLIEFTRQLADVLIPLDLVQALIRAGQRGRPRLMIQPSPSLANIPWGLLHVRVTDRDDPTDPGANRALLVDVADVCLEVPAQAAADAAPPAHPTPGALVAVVDPKVPGYAATSELGSVLGRPDPRDRLSALVDRHRHDLRPAVESYTDLVRRSDQTTDWLAANLAGADRFLYLGHVSAAGQQLATGASSALHLADVDPATGAHRPVRAEDILARSDLRFPARVALVGCGSGTDLQYPEPMGLTLAAVLRGARTVISTLWTLPTDAALPGEPLRRLALAVDAALSAPDPVAALNAWQRERARAWLAHGRPEDSPLVFAAAIAHVR